MSAAGRLGVHKYRETKTSDWTNRTYHIAEDIRPKKDIAKCRTIAQLKMMELRAINNPKCKLRPILHKGMYKH